MSVAIDELETAVAEMESRLESARAERDEAKARQVELEIENANLRRDLAMARERQSAGADEARERETATAGILKAIASSPSDVRPVFQAIADSAKRLLGGFSATVLHFIGDELHLVAFTPTNSAADEGLQASFPRRVTELPVFELVRDGATIQFPDTEAENVPATNRDLGRLRGFRSVLFVPLMNRGNAVGILSVTRTEPGAFADHHVQLLQTFADQAVIAIENARLFNETKEALERQTATAEILKVIASSPSDVQPVFDAIAHSANRLIGGFSAAVFRYRDGQIHLEAFTPTDAEGDAVLQSSFPVPLEQFPPYHLTRAGTPAELPDTETESAARDIARARGYRSMLFAPLMNEGEAVGVITVTRVAPGPFGEQNTRLLQMFADQAAIAIRNVGLFKEVQARTEDLSESLRQQTAVGDVLKTISRSTFDLQPVLDTLVNSAAHLCDADMAFIMRRVGDEYRAGAAVGYTEAYIDFLTNNPLTVDRGTVTGRAVLERRPVQILDVAADPEYTLHETYTLASQRTAVGVPLLREDEPIGVIVLARQRVEAFTDKQIDLVATFADQAVIAIENVRLFNEVRRRTEDLSEALQQQTATADVLKVISRSAFDLETVLDALLSSACRLCEADIGTVRYREGNEYRLAATFGCKPEWIEHFRRYSTKPDRSSVFGRTIVEGHTVHIPDLLADPDYNRPQAQKLMGFRAALGVPLMREGEAFGVINLFRLEVSSFSDRQIELVQTFADQAEIAIENVRLFEEVQAKTRDLSEALTYQTGSANILKVIASSPTDVKPVLKAIVESACELCEAYDAVALLQDGDDLRISAHHGPIPINIEKWPINRRWTAGRAFVDRKPVHVHDLLAEGDEFPDGRELSQRMGHRSILSVPLLREGDSIGAIVLRRTEVNPFTEKQISLLQTFADQAVIAIGNVRLFEEVQARTRDLGEALEQQTATSEVLSVISRSAGDLAPVFDAMLSNAMQLCSANFGVLNTYDGARFHTAATFGLPPAYDEFRRSQPLDYGPGTAPARLLQGEPHVEINRLMESEAYLRGDPNRRALVDIGGARSLLAVPLLKDDRVVGNVLIFRQEDSPFSEKQITLLKQFAAQAVIAIENTRLLSELRQRTEDLSEALTYQTGSANILRVIASSPTDVQPVLKAIVESACELCEAYDAVVILKEGEELQLSAHHGPIPMNRQRWDNDRSSVSGRAMAELRPIHVHDVLADEGLEFTMARNMSLVDGCRTLVSAPLIREGEAIGTLVLRRAEVHPFSDKQISLLQTFADQAVIAIGNVRLFEEVQARTRELGESLQQQTATADVLKVISRSAFDLQTVLETLITSAVELSGANRGSIFLREGDVFPLRAASSTTPEFLQYWAANPPRAGRGSATSRVILSGKIEIIPDVLEDPEMQMPTSSLVRIRAALGVPMLRDNKVEGVLVLTRPEPGPFTKSQIDLVQTFADQAVIAVENVRLFDETQARTKELAKSLDDLRTAQDRLVQTEKLASLGQLTAGIAHEIKNPLNFVNNFAALSAELTEELNDALRQAEVGEKIRAEVNELTGLLKDNLEKVVQHGRRADSIVKNMLLHSREGGGEHRPSDINALIEESLNLAYHGARAEKPGFNVTLERDFDPAAGQIDLFPQEITRVILNLVSNGFYAVSKRAKESGGPGFEPTLRAATKNLGEAVEIRIRDNGTGIPPDVREKMFNPFFTTKPAGEGTGLGLSMSHDIIVKQHGGTIDVDTVAGHFTEFRIVLPRTSNFSE